MDNAKVARRMIEDLSAGRPVRIKSNISTGTLFRGSEKSLWDFWKHGVTSSFLSLYTTDQEQCRLAYVEGWNSRLIPLAIEFGSCSHFVLEQIYTEMRHLKLTSPERREKVVRHCVDEYQRKWNMEVPKPSNGQIAQQEMVYGLAEATLPTYLKRWDGDFNGGKYSYKNQTKTPKEWVSLEQYFSVPYTFTDGAKTFIRGKMDGVFKDKAGKCWVFDTKCRSVINHDDALETLPFDLQQMLYLWVAVQKGYKPHGTMMNIIRRPGLRRSVDETLRGFLERVKKDVSNAARLDHYFIRYQMSIGKDEIASWQRQVLDPLMQTVRMWWEGKIPHYLNGNALITKYGRCPMFLPIVKGEFGQCYRRKAVFPELVGAPDLPG